MTTEPTPSSRGISRQALKRLPFYLSFLRSVISKGEENISAPTIARALDMGEVQVRKDLAAISRHGGRPKTGYNTVQLIGDIEDYLGYKKTDEAVLVGAGHLGKALLSYRGFDNYGLKIVAAFDKDPQVYGQDYEGKKIYPLDKLTQLTQGLGVKIGIITVPADQAQAVCDLLIAGNVLAIWNFSPVHLTVPSHIMVQNENMAASLVLLSRHLTEQFQV